MIFLKLFLFLLPLGWAPRAFAETLELCNIRISGPEKIDFTSTERKWLCGDPDSPAWKEIPVNQQRAWLRSFLQNRGYHHHEIEVRDGRIFVQTGRKSVVERFTVEGAPPEWNWAKRRKVKGAVLDPARMDDNTNWAKRALQTRGYPCPKVEAKAFLDTNELLLEAEPGPKQKYGKVMDGARASDELDPRLLERFTAFSADDDFDIRMLELTSDRILREDLYLSTFYDVACDDQQRATITRRFVPAAPRLLTFGVGFDTENGPIARARWKRTRLTRKADSLESTLFGSFREQRAEVRYRNHFPSDPASRLEFDPAISVDHRDEKDYETITYQAEPVLGYSWPNQNSSASMHFGPIVRHTVIRRGSLPGNATQHPESLRFVADLGFMSHLFEYYAGEPQEGWNVGVQAWDQLGGLFGQKSVQQVMFRQEALWNLGAWEPPLLVLGWRGFEGSYSGGTVPGDLEPEDRYFLGGDQDIRGFGRQQLPGRQDGYLTVLYQGVELRIVEWLPYKLQPFVFFDFAQGGYRALKLDSPLYYAPGLGMRWSSPVGTLRASLARGYASRQDVSAPVPNLQFFISFGKEF